MIFVFKRRTDFTVTYFFTNRGRCCFEVMMSLLLELFWFIFLVFFHYLHLTRYKISKPENNVYTW